MAWNPNWHPSMDALARWQGLSPAEQNWDIAYGERDNPNETPWGAYGRVLNARGAQMGGARTAQSSSIADDPTSTWNTTPQGGMDALYAPALMASVAGDPRKRGTQAGMSTDALFAAIKGNKPLPGKGY